MIDDDFKAARKSHLIDTAIAACLLAVMVFGITQCVSWDLSQAEQSGKDRAYCQNRGAYIERHADDSGNFISVCVKHPEWERVP